MPVYPADLLSEDLRARRAAEGVDPDELFACGRDIAAELERGGHEYRDAAWGWLDFVRRGVIPSRIAGDKKIDEAWPLILRLLDASQFTLGAMLDQRAASYGAQPMFLLPGRPELTSISWSLAVARVAALARGLLTLAGHYGNRPVAFLSENRVDMALIDLACLTTGIVDVMIPATLGDEEAGDVLGRVQAGAVVVSGVELERRVERLRPVLPSVHTVVNLDDPDPAAAGVIGVPELLARGSSLSPAELERVRETVRIDRLATIMFTSGTTGRPKGIQFSLRNLLSKRFARGLALPEIGHRDVFLCFLPLFHTFGRYLEMLGCAFWGATYAAVADPSLESVLDGFARMRPTTFISIPRRWTQLHEEAARRVDLERAGPDEAAAALRTVVGDRLKWGLSAAGYLSPDTFRFFQRGGVELMSGFGMTEATGGITMTPPGQYRDESLGVPLPGVEVRLEPDGEMSVRGPYVMLGYFHEAQTGLDREGWLRTGDLFERDSAGHYRLVDRKKEIYKNSKGQTIAPQRIENLFRDFAAVRRVFLVGDHREYNTVLIVPEPAFAEGHLANLSSDEQRDAFRSVVASVNRFLAPYERIVDFAILPHDFSQERGELTPKGTFRRPQVAENFADVIAPMYRRTWFRSSEEGPALIFPNWLFQALALTAGDVVVSNGALCVPSSGARLTFRYVGQDDHAARLQIGSCLYQATGVAIDLGLLVTCPDLWLGNDELIQFTPVEANVRLWRERCPPEIAPLGRAVPYAGSPTEFVRLESAGRDGKLRVEHLDLAARALGSADAALAAQGLDFLSRALDRPQELSPELTRQALRGAATAPLMVTRREALKLLWPAERDDMAETSLRQFLGSGPDLVDESTAIALAAESFSEAKLEALIETTLSCTRAEEDASRCSAAGLCLWLGRHGADHPGRYQRIRWTLAHVHAHARGRGLREAAGAARREMVVAFRRWLGQAVDLAVDPDTREEYRWADAVVFDDAIPADERVCLLGALSETSILREAIFLLSGGATVRLTDIPQRGVHIASGQSYHGRTLYRVTVTTRYYGSFEIALLRNRELADDALADELLWLVATGTDRQDRGHVSDRLVPEFGGFWSERALWTEEYVSGQPAGPLAERLAAADAAHGTTRLAELWPVFVWTASEAYLEFWNRTARQLVISRPSPSRVVVPTHDYQIGARLITITPRAAYEGPAQLIDLLETRLVAPLVSKHPLLRERPSLPLVCSALLEVVGVEEGLGMIEAAGAVDRQREAALKTFAAEVREHGFVPRRLFFAIERYRRWAALAPDATREAKAFTIRQLKDTYQLARVYAQLPEARARFFRETVLRGATGPLGDALDAVVDALRRGELQVGDLAVRLDAVREHTAPGSDEEYFLVRLSWPHLRPGDTAGFVSHERGGVRQSEVVVQYEDGQGRPFRVRRPLTPREVGDLHRLFLASHLPVSFRPDHQFLVAIDDAGRLIGGVFYELEVPGRDAYLEKIVVAEPYRQMGVSQALMNELLHRLGAAGIRTVSTGFFRPEYFQRFGFKVDRAYGGQVRILEDETRPAL